jgi:hypothetical protein
MAHDLAPQPLSVPRAVGISLDQGALGALTVQVLVSGLLGYAVVTVVHERSGEIVHRQRVYDSVEIALQRGATVAETYTITAADPSSTLPAAAVSGIRPPATVTLRVEDPAPPTAVGFS